MNGGDVSRIVRILAASIVTLLLLVFVIGIIGYRGGTLVLRAYKDRERISLVTDIERRTGEYRTDMDAMLRVEDLLAQMRYDPQTLNLTITEELSEGGLRVLDIPSIRESTSDLGSSILVDVVGALPMNRIIEFLGYLSAQPKIWRVQRLDLVPRISGSDVLARFAMLHERGAGRDVTKMVEELKNEDWRTPLFDVKLQLRVIGRQQHGGTSP